MHVPSILSQGLGDEVPELAKGGESDEQGMAALRRYYLLSASPRCGQTSCRVTLSTACKKGARSRSSRALPVSDDIPCTTGRFDEPRWPIDVEVSYDARRRGFVLKARAASEPEKRCDFRTLPACVASKLCCDMDLLTERCQSALHWRAESECTSDTHYRCVTNMLTNRERTVFTVYFRLCATLRHALRHLPNN